MAGQTLATLVQQALRYTAVCVRTAGGLAAIVMTVAVGFQVSIFAGGPTAEGDRHSADLGALQQLLSEAGLPADSGWTSYQPSGT